MKTGPSGALRQASQAIGAAAEQAALAYLAQRGLSLVERNFRCRGGEIDLVMRDNGTLVFVEVRRRASSRYGGAAASIDAGKRARLAIAAQTYLQRYRLPPACRFDVVAIDGESVSWIRNAIEE